MDDRTNRVNQDKAVDKLSRLRSGALFMECGTGKTKVAFDLIKRKRDEIDLIIWIAPASLVYCDNYGAEIKKWTRNLNRPIHFFSIETIAYNDHKFLEMYDLALYSKSFCVVDESLTIKNASSKRTQRLTKNYNIFDYRLILNGTPVTKGLMDLYSQIQFLSPRILDMTKAQFSNKFLACVDGRQRWSSPKQEEILIETIRPYIFDSKLELQVKSNRHDIGVDLTEEETISYQKSKNEFLERKGEIRFLSIIQRFQSFYTDNVNKQKAVSALINEIRSRGEKVIIYVKFLSEVSFFKKNFDCVIFTSKEKGNLGDFKSSKDILICTYGVGSMGLNLQFCNNIIYYSQTFDYGQKEQSFYRIYRIGQEKNINIYNLWVNDVKLEEIIKESLSKKDSTLKNLKRIILKAEAAEL